MSCWDANLSHFRLNSIIIILVFRVPKPLFPLTVLLTLLTRVVLYISWLLIAYFSAHFYHYKDSRLTVTSPRPKKAFILPETRQAVKHLTCIWRTEGLYLLVWMTKADCVCYHMVWFFSWASGLKAELVSLLLSYVVLFYTASLPSCSEFRKAYKESPEDWLDHLTVCLCQS